MCYCGETEIKNITCLYNFTEEEENICCTLTNFLSFYGQLIVCFSGLFLNTITILLFFDKKLASVFFNRLLLCLAIIDNLYLTSTLLEVYIFSKSNLSFHHHYAFYFIVYPARGITMCCTIYMTVVLALERYTSIVSPHTNPRVVSWTRVARFVGPVVLFLSLIHIWRCRRRG